MKKNMPLPSNIGAVKLLVDGHIDIHDDRFVHGAKGLRTTTVNYGKRAYIAIARGTCDMCHTTTTYAVHVDTSEGICGALVACRSCISELVKEIHPRDNEKEVRPLAS